MEPQQEQPNVVEQCLAILTNILNRQTQQPTLRTRIEKEIRYLPAFEGKPGTLPAFLTSVDRVLAEYGNQAPQVYVIIYNSKILGPAKNYLETAPPATWEECKAKLKLHYKPSKDQGRITQEISTLKVSSIVDLLDKIRLIINDISECAIFSEYQNHIVNNLSSMLVLKIKEITAGALAAELYNKYSLEEIRIIINKYVGQDEFNLKFQKSNPIIKDRHPQIPNLSRPNQNFRQNRNNTGQYRQGNFNNSGQFRNNNNFNNNNSGHFRNNNFNNNNSGQFRNNNNFNNINNGQVRRNFTNNSAQRRHQPQNNNNQVQPMDVDSINNRHDVNQLGETEFFIN